MISWLFLKNKNKKIKIKFLNTSRNYAENVSNPYNMLFHCVIMLHCQNHDPGHVILTARHFVPPPDGMLGVSYSPSSETTLHSSLQQVQTRLPPDFWIHCTSSYFQHWGNGYSLSVNSLTVLHDTGRLHSPGTFLVFVVGRLVERCCFRVFLTSASVL